MPCRALLAWLPQPEKALKKMTGATKPGGWLFIEEPDFSSFGAVDPGYPSADHLNEMYRIALDLLKKGGFGDMSYGRRVRAIIEHFGFLEVGNDGSVLLGRGGTEPSTRFMQISDQVTGRALVAAGLLTQEHLEAIMRLYQDPGFYFVGPTTFRAWGKRP